MKYPSTLYFLHQFCSRWVVIHFIVKLLNLLTFAFWALLQLVVSWTQIILVTLLYADWTLFWMLSQNCWKAPADDSTTDIGLIWWMLHLFSLPSVVVSNTMLSFTNAATLWSNVYAESKGPLRWSFTNTNWPAFRSEALVNVLSFVDSVTLFSMSNLVCTFHSFLSSYTAIHPGWSPRYLQ